MRELVLSVDKYLAKGFMGVGRGGEDKSMWLVRGPASHRVFPPGYPPDECVFFTNFPKLPNNDIIDNESDHSKLFLRSKMPQKRTYFSYKRYNPLKPIEKGSESTSLKYADKKKYSREI